MGESLDTEIQKYIRALRLAGTPVSCSLVLAAAEGIVVSKDRTDELVMNWNQTGLHLVPSGNWTLEKEGASRVEVVGQDDKRMITATFATTLVRTFLPIQLLYTGKTPRCHSYYTGFPADFDVWHSPNHWANQETSLRFIHNIIIPYVQKTRAEKGLSPTHQALPIFDVFHGQTVDEVYEQYWKKITSQLFWFLAIVLISCSP